MKFGIFLSVVLCLFCSTPALASRITPFQAWSIIRYSKDVQDYKLAAQLQNRYSFRSEHMFEEQVNLSVGRSIGEYDLNFIFTLGSVNGYERLRELRYALESERDFTINADWTYNLRLRYEARDFSEIDPFAHRFRVRNEVKRNLVWHSLAEVYLSNEINIYLNDYEPGVSGFSSTRTILGGTFKQESFEWGLAYLNDYRESPGSLEVRHVLVGTLEF